MQASSFDASYNRQPVEVSEQGGDVSISGDVEYNEDKPQPSGSVTDAGMQASREFQVGQAHCLNEDLKEEFSR